MAILTLRAEPFFMGIFFLMTTHAGRRGISESRGLVTLLALQLHMTAGQGKSGLGMIVWSILPTGFLVARFAFDTQLPLMQIILAVARNTS